MSPKHLSASLFFLLACLTLNQNAMAGAYRRIPERNVIPSASLSTFTPLTLLTVQSYHLKPGDTLTLIAREHGISVDTILSFNHILAPRYLRAGQEIAIPNMDGYLMPVPQATAVATVAARYQVRPDCLLFANLNTIKNGLISGEVFLPGAILDSAELRQAMGDVLCWPTINARISSRFGKREDPFTGAPSTHKGMDIAAKYGAPVFAALDGSVSETGVDSLLGKYIKINHGNGVRTTYGHLSLIQVKRGQTVERGQGIGKVGSTGYSTGPHLHFVVYRNNKLVNPLLMTN